MAEKKKNDNAGGTREPATNILLSNALKPVSNFKVGKSKL